MVREKTIGFIIFRRQGKSVRYLLLHHGGDYWNFPKGRQEAGEDEVTSARRELEEETGITAINIIPDFRDEYDYDFDTEIRSGVKERIYKKAIFFMAQAETDEVKISDEHIDHGWFDYDTALKRLFFQNGQNLLKRAHKFLLNKQDFVL
ncbi:MAG: NUDIX domain-containing protein [Candidatus Buchananbacteria bacterium]|nr:NUDIX domain-containing protein [Candidatus Buchananbacteria bacterium]